MSIIHEQLIEALEEIETMCLEELGYPPCCMSFSFSLKEGANAGRVICNRFDFDEAIYFTDEKVEAFEKLFLSKLW